MGDIEARRVRLVEVTTPSRPLRPLAALRLRGAVPVRGGLAARGAAAGRRALPGLPAARGAARPGGAARAARRGRPDGAGAGAPVADGGPADQGRGGRRRSAAGPGPAHRCRAGRAGCRGGLGGRAGGGAARDPGADRGREHWAAIEDAGRLRDALGTALPVGVPEAFTEPVKDPLGDLLARYARTHGPFTSSRAGERFGLGTAVTDGALQRLAASGRVVQGEFHPSGIGQEWCDATVLRRLRRRSLAALRHELEPVPRRPSPPSRRSGSTWGATACAASTAWPGRSSSSRAPPSRPRPWRSWSCRPGSGTTPRRCWTS